MNVRSALILLVAALVLAGCSSSPDDTVSPAASGPASTSPARPSPASTSPASTSPTASSTPTARTIDAHGHSVSGWATPTGNISCALLSDGKDANAAVRCDIDKAAWKGPAKPKSCQFEWGTSVSLHDGKPAFACVNDPIRYAAQVGEDGAWWYRSGGPTVTLGGDQFAVLAYGDSMKLGTITCTSERSALTCTDKHTSHGFHYAEAAYDFF